MTADAGGDGDGLLRAVFDAIPMQTAILDSEGTVVRTNEAWEAFDMDGEIPVGSDMTGQDYLAACRETETGARATAGIESVLAGERDHFTMEHPATGAERNRWFLLTVVRIEDQAEPHVLIVNADITERKLDELAVTERNDLLEVVASVLSHDLRNPLNVIISRADMLSDPDIDLDPTEHATVIESSARRMHDILEDALLLARGAEVVAAAEVDLAEQAREAWVHVETPAGAELKTPDTRTVEAEQSLLSQLLENLFRNAVEHAEGDPTVVVGPTPDGFYVADDGPGIPEHRRDEVFEPGYTTNEDDGGTGLGLAIVHRIAEAHGWTVNATTGPLEGARFEFHLE